MKLSSRIRNPKARRGAQMLEFTLLFPVFLFLIIFTFDMGRLVWTNISLQDAAQTAARAGAQLGGAEATVNGVSGPSKLAFYDVVSKSSQLTDLGSTFAVSTGGRCTATGDNRFVTINATQEFSFMTPGLNSLVGFGVETFTVNVAAVSRCEVVR